MVITEEWANSAWPWLVHRANAIGITPPDGPVTAAIPTLLPELAARAEQLDAMSNGYILAYALSVLNSVADLERHTVALSQCASFVNEASGEAAADQLATSALARVEQVRRVSLLADSVAAALRHCTPTELVLAARKAFEPPSTSPTPPAVTPLSAAPEPARGDIAQAGSSTVEQADLWEVFCAEHPVGSLVQGRVTSTKDFGAFVNLQPGVNGLIHISKLADRRIQKVTDVVQIGQSVTVKIVDITPRKDGEKGKISLSLRDVDHDSTSLAGMRGDHGVEQAEASYKTQEVFLEAARRFLLDQNDEPRPMMREMMRAKGGWIVAILRERKVGSTSDVVGALIDSLIGQALARPLARRQLEILTLARAATTVPRQIAQADALRWVSNDTFVPDAEQVRDVLVASGNSRAAVVELIGHGLVRAASRAIQEQNATTAALVLDAAVELGQDLSQSRASELKDLLSSIELPSTARLRFDELRDRANPANRPDLAAIADPDHRATLLGAVPMVNADVAVEVARTHRDELLDQALMWLAQQLGDSIARWMPPRVQHPAVTAHEKQLAEWRARQRQQGRSRPGRRTEREAPVGLKQEVVDRAVRGDAAAARQAAQELDSLLRASDSVAEEWDAFLTATLDRSGDAAPTWQRIKNPSPEVCWNLAVFEGNHRFSKHLAWRPLERALGTHEANPRTLLHALYHAVKTLIDPTAGSEAAMASAQLVADWGPEVPEGRVLLAALALMDATTEDGYASAREAFSRWSRLADSPTLAPVIPRRGHADARQAIQNLRANYLYARRWVLLVLCDAALAADRAVSLVCLTAGAEVAEQLNLMLIARGLYSRAVDIAQKQMHRPRPGTEDGVRRTFATTCISALTFARKTEDPRLARQVRSAVAESGGEPNLRITDLLTELLGVPALTPTGLQAAQSPTIFGGTTVPPALAQLAQSFSEVRAPADMVKLRHRLLSALNIVKAEDDTVRAVSELMAQLDRLAGGVGIGEVRDLLTEIGQLCERLERAHGRSGDHSLAAMLKAVDVARRFAADQVEDAPTPSIRIADRWYGLAIESERPHLVLTVTGPAEAEITNVTIFASGPRVQVGRLLAGEERTIWVPTTEPVPQPGFSRILLTVTWTWGMVADRSVNLTLDVPVSSWGNLLGEAGLPGQEVPNRFVIGEPLSGEQISQGLFQGRKDHLEHVRQVYGKSLPAQPTVFHGIPKVGKSSLLNAVVHELRELGRMVVVVTAQGLQPDAQGLDAIVFNLCRRIVRADPRRFTGFDMPARVENGVAFLEDFLTEFAQIGVENTGMAPILVIDEFQVLYRPDVAPLLDVLRITAESREVGFIFAAMEGRSGLPMTTSLHLIRRRVDFLLEREVTMLVDDVFADTPVRVPPDVARRLFDAAAGHPYFTAAVAHRALDAANKGRRNLICANDVDLAVADLSARVDMFEISWFHSAVLADKDRETAIDLAASIAVERGWIDVADVLARLGDGGKDRLNRLENAYVMEGSATGDRTVRVRGGLLERFLRTQHGVRLIPSPDPSTVPVGVFLDVENLIRGVSGPVELVDRVARFSGRFGKVVIGVTSATQSALTRAGWRLQQVEAAFSAVGWRFLQPPPALAGNPSAADNQLTPIITASAESYNLAEVIIGSGDHSFIYAAQTAVGDSGDGMTPTGRRVHALSLDTPSSEGRSPRHGEWERLAQRRYDICQVLGQDHPDVVLWNVEDLMTDPEGAAPMTPLEWPTRS